MDYAFDTPWTVYVHMASDSSSYVHSYVHYLTLAACPDWGTFACHGPPVEALFHPKRAVLHQKRPLTSVSCFRHTSLPEWEHASNRDGCTLSARGTLPPNACQTLWENLVAECVRGAAHDGLNGVQLTRKWSRAGPCVRIDLWLRAEHEADDVLASLPVLPKQFTFEASKRH